jgi:queuine tRNA-ribosyltransferase
MYAVIHGGIHKTLRQLSCEHLAKLPFEGFAIGGSMGKTKDQMIDMLEFTLPFIPYEKPNHLLGIGDLESIERAVPLGIDTFDSSYPTRAARHGVLLTKQGPLKILKNGNSRAFRPPEEGCPCSTCRNYSLAYLNHLFKAKETTALVLSTIHNLHFMVDLMRNTRESILRGEI